MFRLFLRYEWPRGRGKVFTSQLAHSCLSLTRSTKRPRVLLLPLWVGSKSIARLPRSISRPYHLYTWVKTDSVEQSFLSEETIRWQRSGPDVFKAGLSLSRINAILNPNLHIYKADSCKFFLACKLAFGAFEL